MLDLDLDLEADLGVDTVKQAELLAAIRGLYNIPRDENLKLRDFPTLAHVIKFAHDKLAASGLKAPRCAAPAVGEADPKRTGCAGVADAGLARSSGERIPRRVPVPSLRPPLDICKPTGVTLGPGRRVVMMPDKGWSRRMRWRKRLQALGVEVLRSRTRQHGRVGRISSRAGWPPVRCKEFTGCPRSIMREVSATWIWPAGSEALRVRVKSLYTTMRLLYEQIAAPGTFLVSATRLGGQHGYDDAGAVAPLGGAVVGFTKTYKRERMDVLVKAVDFEAGREASEVAEILIEETLRDPGAVEIGYKEGLRWTVGLQEQPAADGQPGLTLDENTVFRRHRRGGKHRLGHHRRSGSRIRRHLLPARSGAGARSRESRPRSVSSATKTD